MIKTSLEWKLAGKKMKDPPSCWGVFMLLSIVECVQTDSFFTCYDGYKLTSCLRHHQTRFFVSKYTCIYYPLPVVFGLNILRISTMCYIILYLSVLLMMDNELFKKCLKKL